MSNLLKTAYDNILGNISGMEEVSNLRDALKDYHHDSLSEAKDMAGVKPFTPGHKYYGFDAWHYDDIGGRPAPLDPNQYPNWEEVDAIRHYYGPQVMAEADGGGLWQNIKSVAGPLWHELEGVVQGDPMEQIGVDLYNNAVANYDEFTGRDKFPATGLLNRLRAFNDGKMPKEEFAQFARHALGRTKVPSPYGE